jgi:hypothetical protein
MNKESNKSESWVEAQAKHQEEAFNKLSKDLIWQLTIGGGISNVHILDTLRQLEWLYLTCAAYRAAAKDAKL